MCPTPPYTFWPVPNQHVKDLAAASDTSETTRFETVSIVWWPSILTTRWPDLRCDFEKEEEKINFFFKNKRKFFKN